MKRVVKAAGAVLCVLTILFCLSIPAFLFLCRVFPDAMLGPAGQRIGKDTAVYWNDGRWQIVRSPGNYVLTHMGDDIVQEVTAYASDEECIYVVGRGGLWVIDRADDTYRRYDDAQAYEEAAGRSMEDAVFKTLERSCKTP